MITKEFELVEKSAPSVQDSVGSWVISSTSYDRVNDRISLAALKSTLGKDVLTLWQHSSDQPVGRWTNLRLKGEQLVADLILAKTDLGNMIRELLAVKTPLGASIGFKGSGKKNEKGGIDFDTMSLLETSIVSVPCNAEAMQIAKQFHITLPSTEGDASAVSGATIAVQKRAAQAIIAAKRTLKGNHK